MVDAETPASCPRCNTPLPPQAPAGICPKCLLEAGLQGKGLQGEDAFAQPAASQLAGTTPAPGFTPPSLDEIAPAFPQLEFLELVGRGGMGAVYKARQRDLDRIVAVKILPPEVGADPAFAERFLREARALAKLSHPNIVTVYDFGESRGLFYFMMEYVEGANLRHLLTSSRMQPSDALAIIPQICEALQFAHDAGVVHRDIKPENILVSTQGQVKIADFGLVKLLGARATDYSLTGTQQVMGTVHYMAPEQVQHTHAVDHRADIYSLGVVFYEMLTGHLPLGRFELPSKNASIDVRLDDIVLRSLESNPVERYQHAQDVRTDIESLATSKPPRPAPAQMQPTSTPPQPAPAKPLPIQSGPPRFSRKAIIGALWSPLFFIAILLSLVSFRTVAVPEPVQMQVESMPSDSNTYYEHGMDIPAGQSVEMARVDRRPPRIAFRYDWLMLILAWSALGLGLTSPFGTTLLGVIALSDIRHSQGRLTGRGLAVYDALVYPLIVLDLLVIALVGSAFTVLFMLLAKLFDSFDGGKLAIWFMMVIPLLPALLVCALMDFFIVRAVWRRSGAPPA